MGPPHSRFPGALPEGCVQRAVQLAGGSFPGWEDIDVAFERARSTGFKKVFSKQSGLSADTNLDALLASILERCRTRPHPALQGTVRVVIDHARMAGRPFSSAARGTK
jgi:hypothetical protein